MKQQHTFRAMVQIFPQDKGWHYVSVPTKIPKPLEGFAERGLIPIVARVGSSTWNTSLLPLGNGTHFIALPMKVRDKENLRLGKTASVTFKLRG